jgi:histone-lysine N-methyltransferase SUV39H
VDSINCGNEARWVNHCCDPNLKVFGVFASRRDSRYAELAFFAKKDIAVGEELTIDYFYVNEDNNTHTIDGADCLCKAKNCRKYLMD